MQYATALLEYLDLTALFEKKWFFQKGGSMEPCEPRPLDSPWSEKKWASWAVVGRREQGVVTTNASVEPFAKGIKDFDWPK